MVSSTQVIRRRSRRRASHQQRTQQRMLLWGITSAIIVFFGVIPLAAALALGFTLYTQAVSHLPDDPRVSVTLNPTDGTTRFYDRTGATLLWEVTDPLGDQREWVTLNTLPPYVVAATLLREDPNFLQTAQSDPLTTLQRVAYNLWDGPIAPEPTMVGRLVRGTILPAPEIITAEYRTQEYLLAAELLRRYTPEEILEWHLNTNPYGNDIYGIDAAARLYYGKPAAQLTIEQAALLAAIPTAPQYNPIDNPAAARGRQADLLRDLLLNTRISEADYNAAIVDQSPIQENAAQTPAVAPEYTLYARRQAEAILNRSGYNGAQQVSRGGLTILTTLDLPIQGQLECTLAAHLARLQGLPTPSADECVGVGYLPPLERQSLSAPNVGAAALIDVNSGELLAAVGDMREQTRQPAPLLHPFVYLARFAVGDSAAKMVLDVPLRFPGAADGLIYTPTNADGAYRGPMSLRTAMNTGALPPVTQLANSEGLDDILRTARLLGLSGLDPNAFDLSLLERGGGVSVLDAAYTYSVFGAMGQMHGLAADNPDRTTRQRDPVAVLQISDSAGNVIWAYDEAERAQSITPLLDAGLAYLVNHVLADPSPRSALFGVSNPLQVARPAAVIFGHDSANLDHWAVGYSPRLSLAVWVGRNDGTPIAVDAYGLDSAVPVWHALMNYAHDRYSLPADDWLRPLDVIEARVCERSGLQPNGVCPERTEIFLQGTQPPETDTYWQAVTVNTQTGLLATANTPNNFQEERVYFVPPTEALAWWESAGLPLPPQTFDTITRPELVRSTVILRPELLDYVGGQVPIVASLDAAALQYWQLAYGAGPNPSAWIDITGQRTDYTPGQALTTWDTSGLDGLYNLRLTAVLQDNSLDPYLVQVTVDNTAPTVSLQAGDVGQVFTFLGNDDIPIAATVQDNVAIARVEFYANGQFVGTDETFPFGYNHPITRVGVETFDAVAYDRADNAGNAQIVIDVARGGT
ncbi:MAG: penicillin-binding protein [Phototrophicaceae bacterium]